MKIKLEEVNEKSFKYKKLVKDIVTAEYGFYCGDPSEFPTIENSYEISSIITNIVIDMGKNEAFNFAKLVANLNTVNCFVAYIRLFDDSGIIAKITAILECFKNSTIRNVQFEILNNKDKVVEEDLVSINKIHPKFRKVIVRSAKMNKTHNFNNFECVFLKASPTDSNDDCACGLVSPYNFAVNYSMFFESLHFNNCLNKKIAIDIKGNIKNCPFHQKSYTHIDEIANLKDFITSNTQFKSVWNIAKDKIEVCKDCEFRYICQDCRVFTKDAENPYSKPKHCKYNPYKAEWDN